MLGAENGLHLHPRGGAQQRKNGTFRGIDAGVVGDHPDFFALERGQCLFIDNRRMLHSRADLPVDALPDAAGEGIVLRGIGARDWPT